MLFSSCPHITPKPGAPGKIIWMSGAPGAGKSTVAKGPFTYDVRKCFELLDPLAPMFLSETDIK